MCEDLKNGNLFMICEELNRDAIMPVPDGYHVRCIHRDELETWMAMHFDDPADAVANRPMMYEFYNNVYGERGDLFYRSCLMICDGNDTPVGTCFAWCIYGAFWTIHWFKVLKPYEGRGLGRALFSRVMDGIPNNQYPVFLHTHPGSHRAIKLYTDFGFALLTDEMVGHRKNHLSEAEYYIKGRMTGEAFGALRYRDAPEDFLKACYAHPYDHF